MNGYHQYLLRRRVSPGGLKTTSDRSVQKQQREEQEERRQKQEEQERREQREEQERRKRVLEDQEKRRRQWKHEHSSPPQHQQKRPKIVELADDAHLSTMLAVDGYRLGTTVGHGSNSKVRMALLSMPDNTVARVACKVKCSRRPGVGNLF